MLSRNYIVFTDLDGTFLDHHTYSYEAARPGLALLLQHRIPLVFCSAKTRAEQTVYREALAVHDPFIVENGGAIFAQTGYFHSAPGFQPVGNGLEALALARPYVELRRALVEARRQLGLAVQGYGDLTELEVAQLTDLDLAAAARAKAREFEETVVTPLAEGDRERLRQALAERGISMIAGARFLAVSTANDKGHAARLLTELFRCQRGDLVTVGIGDSWNDAPLLAVTDISLLVQRPGGDWASLSVPGIRRINGIGPSGWTLAMRQLVAGEFSPRVSTLRG